MALKRKKALAYLYNRITANNRGSALLLSVLILMIVFTLGTGLLSVVSSNYIMDQAEHDYQAAFYAAEAGLRYQMEVMKAEMDRLYQEGSYTNASAFFNDFWSRIPTRTTLNLDMINDKPVKAEVTTSKGTMGDDFREYKIQSVGSVGRIKRTLESIVRVRYVSMAGNTTSLSTLFSYAIFADGKIELTGSAEVYGDAGTNATFPKGFYLEGKPTVHGDVIIGPNGNIDEVIYIPKWGNIDDFIKGERKTNQTILEFPEIEPMGNVVFPNDLSSKPSLVAQGVDVINKNGGGQFSKIVATGSGKLTINMGDSDDIYTDEILVNGAGKADIYINGEAEVYAGKLSLAGSGKLTFHVTGDRRIYIETLDLTGASAGDIISVQGEGRLLLFIEKDFKRGGSANINLKGDPSKLIVFFNGDKIDFSGGGGDPCFTGGLYAPHAEIDLTGSATVKGSIVASTINMSGGTKVYFERIVDEKDPLFGEQNQQIGPELFIIASYDEK